MTIRYILDTDAITYQQLGRSSILNRLAQLDPATIATTIITLQEQMRGRLASLNRPANDRAMRYAYDLLQTTQRYFCVIKVLPFDEQASHVYQHLSAQKIRIGTQDLRIAAIVLRHQAILVSSNRRHFDLVPGLVIEDWQA